LHIKELKDYFVGGINKAPNPKIKLKNPNVNSLHLETGEKTNVLVIDVDGPDSDEAQAVRDRMRRDDFIVYSNQYTLNDVFEGRCKFKVFYKYVGIKLPRKRDNKNVEVFYGKNNFAAFAGKRGDGYEYKISTLANGEIKQLHFDVNEVVEVKIKEFDLLRGEQKREKKRQKEKEKEKEKEEDEKKPVSTDDEDFVGYDKVNIREFQKQLMQLPDLVENIPPMVKKGEIITFKCLFPDEHTDTKTANAYAFKKDGVYVARCHGTVCANKYWELNKQLKEIALNQIKFDNAKGFGDFNQKHVLFKAPTGWGKTEAIAEEVLKTINNNGKMLVLLQSKEAISRLSDRINEKSGGAFETLNQMGKIYIYTSENKTEEHDLDVNRANVILSHHFYFKNAGNILTYYQKSFEMLKEPNLKVIIDEAHTYIELASRMDLEVGGLYKKESFAGMELWTHNVKKMSREHMEYHNALGEEEYQIKTDVLEPIINDFYSVELRKQWKLYPQVEYLDVVEEIENSEDYELKDVFEEGEIEYSVYKNKGVQPIQPNNISEDDAGLHLLTNSAERIIFAKSKGDDKPRRHLGRVMMTAYHSQFLNEVLNKPSQVILTTATWEKYHDDIVRGLTNDLHVHEENDPVESIGKIVLLRPKKEKTTRIRKQVLETTNDLNARALLFFPTISKAREIAKEYDNIMLNDNGMYSIGKRKSSMDYVDNFVRNVTVAGLESSVAKGYNYLEEVDGNTDGFELVYFDKKPVSPNVIKKYFDRNGKLQDYQSDYKWSAFAQAIGRAFRKTKDVLCVAINDISHEDYNIIKDYIKKETKAEIIEDELNIFNIRISIKSFVNSVGFDELSKKLKDNKLFKKIYETS